MTHHSRTRSFGNIVDGARGLVKRTATAPGIGRLIKESNETLGGPDELTGHILATYGRLRRGIAALGWFFPLVLGMFGLLLGTELRGSMSAYYFIEIDRDPLTLFPWIFFLGSFAAVSYALYRIPDTWLSRPKFVGLGSFVQHYLTRLVTPFLARSRHDTVVSTRWERLRPILLLVVSTIGVFAVIWILFRIGVLDTIANYNLLGTLFVGFLFVTGVVLYLYKGYNAVENILLNVAGLASVSVALFPTNDPGCPAQGRFCDEFNAPFVGWGWHGIAAGVYFICGAAVIALCSRMTLRMFTDRDLKRKYETIYWICFIVMVLAPIAAAIASYVTDTKDQWTYWLETVAMLTFAAYWWIKSDEIDITSFDQSGGVRLNHNTHGMITGENAEGAAAS